MYQPVKMGASSTVSDNLNNRLFYGFLIGWVIVGLVQNYFTEVSGEEAYYWLFSQFPDWGYLDHPPMVGVVTAPGYWLIPNNLGLRLGMLIISVLTIIVIRKTLEVKDDKLLIWILLGSAPVHVGAILVKTDVPLLLFVALFFYFYKQFLKKDDFKTVVLLAFSIAMIMLSKHHGFLVVLFTVVSNIKLLTKRSFWLTVALTVVFMLPHTYWQYINDFATIKFHLYNRIDMGFSWESIAYYLGIQPIVFGPLIGVLLFAASYSNRIKSDFNRALKYTIVGVLVFFLISTFKVEFHKHWTSILAIPLILLGYEYIQGRLKWELWIKRLSIATVILIVPARIYLMYDFFPKSLTKDWDVLHNWETWADEVKELSNGLPIMFNNHYERASRYAYLTKDIVHCYNTFDYRETQHDLLPLEENLQGETVFQINRYRDTLNYKDYITQIGKGIHYRVIENFRSYRKVWIEIEGAEEYTFSQGEKLDLKLSLENRYERDINFANANDRQVVLNVHYLDGLIPVAQESLMLLSGEMKKGENKSVDVQLTLPDDIKGSFDMRFSIQVGEIEPPINSKKYPIVVK